MKNEQDRNKELTDQTEKLKQQYEPRRPPRSRPWPSWRTSWRLPRRELKTLEAKQAELEKAKREAVAAMNATQTNATDYRKEVEAQRTAVEEAQKGSRRPFQGGRAADRGVEPGGQRKGTAAEADRGLGQGLGQGGQVLRKFGLDKNKDYSNVPPKVDGIITATAGRRPGRNLDRLRQGLIKGHQLEVYRIGGGQSTYVGRIEVVRTEPDRAVCKIDPKFQNSNMMVGDRVASKID